MTVQQIASFLKKDRIGGGDLGPRRIGDKQVRLFAVREFDAISKLGAAGIQSLWKFEPLSHAQAEDARSKLATVK